MNVLVTRADESERESLLKFYVSDVWYAVEDDYSVAAYSKPTVLVFS